MSIFERVPVDISAGSIRGHERGPTMCSRQLHGSTRPAIDCVRLLTHPADPHAVWVRLEFGCSGWVLEAIAM
ncbi:hypothetical protein CH277_09280 [Rhodococcus sp. 06-469-3-2]|nr:hypothetical protein CH277_09280 [Rhodococcus sp. 06-469-3-2]